MAGVMIAVSVRGELRLARKLVPFVYILPTGPRDCGTFFNGLTSRVPRSWFAARDASAGHGSIHSFAPMSSVLDDSSHAFSSAEQPISPKWQARAKKTKEAITITTAPHLNLAETRRQMQRGPPVPVAAVDARPGADERRRHRRVAGLGGDV